MKTKILFFMSNLWGGGAERVTVNILRQLNKDKYDIVLLMVKREGVFLEDIPSYVRVEDMNCSKTIFSLLKVRKFIKLYQPDIVYTTMFMNSIVTAFATKNLEKKPYLIMRHPTSPKVLIEEKSLSWYRRTLLEYTYRYCANEIIAQTPEMKNELIMYHLVPEKKITVFFNPIDRELIDKKIKEIENPFEEDKINIVSAGRLTYAKAFDTLLYAFEKVIMENKNYRLHILGEDDGEGQKIFKLVDELNLKKYVKFHGFQSNPYPFFYFSDLYVLSSRREGLPNAVLENLYLKKPIVATNCISFMHELIDENINGYIVDVDNVDMLSSAILNFKLLPNNKEITRTTESVNSLFDSYKTKS